MPTEAANRQEALLLQPRVARRAETATPLPDWRGIRS